jgi:cytochrome c oxidase subunit II
MTRHLRGRGVRRLAALGAGGLLLLLTACASDAPQDTLEPKGPIAREIDNLVNPVFIVAGVVFLIVEGGVLFLMWRFRNRDHHDDDTAPKQVHGNLKAELTWTIAPAVILAFVAVGTVATLFTIEAKADEAEMTVEVAGQQWWWEYRYDVDRDGETDIVTANDLVVPAGTNVKLEITSNDVIHSFWIPALNGKKDAVPGRTHPLTVEADEPGTYVGQCTEFCGLSHAYMRQRLVALSQDDYDAWARNQQLEADMPSDGDAAAGADLFTTQCSTCHIVEGVNDDEYAQALENQDGRPNQVSGTAPDLTHLMTRGTFAGATFDLWIDRDDNGIVEWDEIGDTHPDNRIDREALEAWLRDPPGQKPMAAPSPDAGDLRGMPNYNLSEDQIDQLVAFLETLD